MIRLNHRYILTTICAAATLLSTGCHRQEELIFEGNSNDRVLKTITETDKILRGATNGWQTEYETRRGFKTVLQFQFLDDHKVVTYADYSETPSESTYKYNMTRGAVITFDTYGLLHEMVAPYMLMDQGKWTGSQQAEMGKGFGGDMEFEIMSATPDSVWLRGIKDSNYKFKLVPLTKAPGFSSEFAHNRKLLNDITRENGYAYKHVTLNGQGIGEFSLSFPTGDLQSVSYDKITLNVTLLGDDGKQIKSSHSVSKQDDTFEFEPALQIGGKEYSKFTRSTEDGPLVSVDNKDLILDYDGTCPVIKRQEPPIKKSDVYWTKINSQHTWCSDKFWNDIILNYNKYFKTQMREFAFWQFSDSETLKCFNLWDGNHHWVPFTILMDSGVKKQLEHHKTWFPQGKNYVDGSGIFEMAIYFTDLVDTNNRVYVEKIDNNTIRFVSAKDARYWFILRK